MEREDGRVNAIALAVSGCALLLSLVSFVVGERARRETGRLGRMPVLVFEYDGRRGWLVRNVGNGPALNVVVAQKHVSGASRGEWFSPVRVPPLSRDGEFSLEWLQHDNARGLGATYDDFLASGEGGQTYTTTCGNDLSSVARGRRFELAETEILAHWMV